MRRGKGAAAVAIVVAFIVLGRLLTAHLVADVGPRAVMKERLRDRAEEISIVASLIAFGGFTVTALIATPRRRIRCFLTEWL